MAAWNHDDEQCPLAAVDRRLEDLHRLWHQAETAYFDPDAFRVAIQNAVQTVRTVTFILQKNKGLIPDFDRWYGDWQKKMGAEPLMIWMREARNRIEKEGDLEAHSFVRAEIVASYLNEGPKIEVPAKLSDAPIKLVKSIPQSALGDHIRKDGVVRIQRRWVENTLPEYELLDAVAIAYGWLSQIVHEAHQQLGLAAPRVTHTSTGAVYPEGDRKGRLPCMIGHADARTLDVWLATGVPIEFETINQKVEMKDAVHVEERYDVKLADIYGTSDVVADRARSIFATARKMFEKDGHHIMVAFLLREGKPIQITELRPGEHGHKYLMMRSLAHEVAKVDADAVILVSESWRAPFDPTKPYMRAVESPNRREMLAATLVTKTGDPLHLAAEIIRVEKTVSLGPTTEEQGGAHFTFAPVYEVWKKPVPADWTKAATTDASEKK